MFNSKLETLARALEIKRTHHKSLGAQLCDILRLKLSFAPLSASEYYEYGLYDDRRLSFEEKRKFLGFKGRKIIDQVFNDAAWAVIHFDKLIFGTLIEKAGLPCPRTLAVYDIVKRGFKDIPFATNKNELLEVLSRISYPVFVKPLDAGSGRGAMVLQRFDQATGKLTNSSAASVPFSQFHEQLEREAQRRTGGYLFQELVTPAPEAADFTAGRLAGLRLVVLNDSKKPMLTHAVIKFATGSNIIDNIHGEARGNLLGGVKLESGGIDEVYCYENERYQRVERHPDSGRSFAEFAVPEWENYKATVLEAASLFPGLRLQHWDILVAKGGPKIIEVNVHGCLSLPQGAYQRGFFDGPIRDSYLQLVGRCRSIPIYSRIFSALEKRSAPIGDSGVGPPIRVPASLY